LPHCPTKHCADRRPGACRRNLPILAGDRQHARGNILAEDAIDREVVQRLEIRLLQIALPFDESARPDLRFLHFQVLLGQRFERVPLGRLLLFLLALRVLVEHNLGDDFLGPLSCLLGGQAPIERHAPLLPTVPVLHDP
jgi:hypothetical protein